MVDYPTSLDARRGMAAQKATDLRRLRSEVEADQSGAARATGGTRGSARGRSIVKDRSGITEAQAQSDVQAWMRRKQF